MGAGKSTIPLCSSALCAFRCRLTMFTPSTTTRPVLRCTRSTLPSRPLSSPRSTRTVSPFRTGSAVRSAFAACRRRPLAALRCVARYTSFRMSEYLGRERDDLHVPLLAQFARDRPEDTGGPWLARVVDDHDGVLVEPDVAAILAPRFLHGAHHHGARHLGLLHRAVRERVLHRDNDRVAQPRVAALRAAQHADHERLLRARIVRHLD